MINISYIGWIRISDQFFFFVANKKQTKIWRFSEIDNLLTRFQCPFPVFLKNWEDWLAEKPISERVIVNTLLRLPMASGYGTGGVFWWSATESAGSMMILSRTSGSAGVPFGHTFECWTFPEIFRWNHAERGVAGVFHDLCWCLDLRNDWLEKIVLQKRFLDVQVCQYVKWAHGSEISMDRTLLHVSLHC